MSPRDKDMGTRGLKRFVIAINALFIWASVSTGFTVRVNAQAVLLDGGEPLQIGAPEVGASEVGASEGAIPEIVPVELLANPVTSAPEAEVPAKVPAEEPLPIAESPAVELLSAHHARQENPSKANSQTLSLVLALSARQVYVYSGEALVSSYPVAIGREGWQTPTGQFTVFQKQVDPAWEHPFTGEVVPPGPDNPLGTRWIGFWSDGVNSIGFHGTPDESVIGSAVSHGCVRMRNADVIALYEQISVNTLVTVIP